MYQLQNTVKLSKSQIKSATIATEKRITAKTENKLHRGIREVMDSLHPQIIGIKAYTNHLFQEKYS